MVSHLFTKLTVIESIVALVIGAVTGVGSLSFALARRLNELDSKITRVELVLSRDYVPKEEYRYYQEQLYNLIQRIEHKLDTAIFKTIEKDQ